MGLGAGRVSTRNNTSKQGVKPAEGETLNYDAVATEASANPMGSSGTGVAFQNGPEYKEKSGPLHPSTFLPSSEIMCEI